MAGVERAIASVAASKILNFIPPSCQVEPQGSLHADRKRLKKSNRRVIAAGRKANDVQTITMMNGRPLWPENGASNVERDGKAQCRSESFVAAACACMASISATV
jgi:hypothetical protein